jgi:hypothetical protein
MMIPKATLACGFQQPLWSCCKPLWHDGPKSHSDMMVPDTALACGFQQPLCCCKPLWHEGPKRHSDMMVPETALACGFQRPLWSCCKPLWHDSSCSHSEAAERRLSPITLTKYKYHVTGTGRHRVNSTVCHRWQPSRTATQHTRTSLPRFSPLKCLCLPLHLPTEFPYPLIFTELGGNRSLAVLPSVPLCPQYIDSRWMVLHQITYRKI